MKTGGAFFSAQLPPLGTENPHDVIRQSCIVWGTATLDATDNVESDDEAHSVKGKRRFVSFRIRYGEEPIKYPPGYVRKRGEKLKRVKFMNCRAAGFTNVGMVMAAIEKNDVVLCVGTTKFRRSRNKKGEEISYYTMSVDFVLPMELVGHIMRMYSSQSIRELIEKDENAEADVWESDYL